MESSPLKESLRLRNLERGFLHAFAFGGGVFLFGTLLNAFCVFILDQWDEKFGQAGAFKFTEGILVVVSVVGAACYGVGSVLVRALSGLPVGPRLFMSLLSAILPCTFIFVADKILPDPPLGVILLGVGCAGLGLLVPTSLSGSDPEGRGPIGKVEG